MPHPNWICISIQVACLWEKNWDFTNRGQSKENPPGKPNRIQKKNIRNWTIRINRDKQKKSKKNLSSIQRASKS